MEVYSGWPGIGDHNTLHDDLLFKWFEPEFANSNQPDGQGTYRSENRL